MNNVKKFDTLYCLDKTGKIRLFEIQVLEDTEDTIKPIYWLKSCTGLIGGNLVYNEKCAPQGKQGRTSREQAIFIAESLWNDKCNEGYKSLSDLSLKAEQMEKSIEGLSISEIFRTLEIKYNTDTRWYPLPMLAEKYKTHAKKIKFPQLGQPKLNGVRCITLYDPDLQEVIQVSRGGKTYNVPHIKAQLTPFFLLNQNVILDGELYYHGKPLQEISGAVRKEKDAPDWIEYHIYDCIKPGPNGLRWEAVKQYLREIESYNTTHIKRVFGLKVEDYEQVKAAHDHCVEQGYEGLILRDPKAEYQVSFRDKCLLKVKEFEDAEFEIIGCKVDPDKSVGESFVFQLKNDIDDQAFYARPTGTIKDKEFWYANIQSYIGKKCTVRFQERTQGNLPHQGHVRVDLSNELQIELVDRQDV